MRNWLHESYLLPFQIAQDSLEQKEARDEVLNPESKTKVRL